MQKKLIALAVAGMASTAAFAQSNVTIYGLLQPSYDFMDTNGDKTFTNLNWNNSRIGFKGEEALGNGLKAIFQIETNVAFTERGDSPDALSDRSGLGSRDSWVGLAGSFGSLTFGNHQSAYVRVSAAYDVFADTIGDYNNLMGTFSDDDYLNKRRNASAYYTSPNWGGFQLTGSFALNGRGDTAADAANDTYSIAGSYTNGGFNGFLAFEETGNATGTFEDLQGWKLGASYKFGFGTKLGGIYENAEVGSASVDRFHLVASHPITASLDIMGNYTNSSGDLAAGGDADAYSLGLDYKFSKRTSVQAVYAHVKYDDINNGATIYGIDAGYLPTTGDKVSGFSVRLKHAF